MARIPENELERLKQEVSVERLVEASGIALKKSGKDLLGQCPFHDDGEPSRLCQNVSFPIENPVK